MILSRVAGNSPSTVCNGVHRLTEDLVQSMLLNAECCIHQMLINSTGKIRFYTVSGKKKVPLNFLP